jgi:hypothetical protein
MQIPDRGEEVGHLTELSINVNLLKVSLSETLRIGLIFFVWPDEQVRPVPCYPFLVDDWTLSVVLREAKFILPRGIKAVAPNANLHHNLWIAPRSQATQPGDAAALWLGYCLLEAAAN